MTVRAQMDRDGHPKARATSTTESSPTGRENPSPTTTTNNQQTHRESPTSRFHLPSSQIWETANERQEREFREESELLTNQLSNALHNPSLLLDSTAPIPTEQVAWGTGYVRSYQNPDRIMSRAINTPRRASDPENLNLPPGFVLREGRSQPRPIGSRPQSVYLLVRYLPLDYTNRELHSLLLGFNPVQKSELCAPEHSPDARFMCAIITVASEQGALDVKHRLEGKRPRPSDDHPMELLFIERQRSQGSSPADRRTPESNPESNPDSTSPEQRRTLRDYGRENQFMDGFYSHYTEMPPAARARYESSNPMRAAAFQADSFSQRAAPEDDARNLPWPTRSFPTNGPDRAPDFNAQRRATVPTLPIEQMQNLSVQTNYPATRPFGSASSAHPGIASPRNNNSMNGAPGPSNWHQQQQFQQQQRSSPTANPADMNPPCNTLYVGNLPMGTSEEELKATFSKQRGYKRLCFRTKNNGPMCFVEFDDISCATKVLKEMYGHVLTNSTKGGIRLSFSKNPLGVRSQHNHAHPAQPNGYGSQASGSGSFTTAAGPPPGLSAPPGLAPPTLHLRGHHGFPEGPNGFPNPLHGFSNGQAGPSSGQAGFMTNGQNGFPSMQNGFSNTTSQNGFANGQNGFSTPQSNGLSNGAQLNGFSNGAQSNGFPSGSQSNAFSNGTQSNGLSNGAQSNGYTNGTSQGSQSSQSSQNGQSSQTTQNKQNSNLFNQQMYGKSGYGNGFNGFGGAFFPSRKFE